MPIRDLGYRPYEGERLPPSHNTVVLLRHGLRRAWGAWLVKIAVFIGWVPPLVAIAYLAIRFFLTRDAPTNPEAELQAGAFVRGVLGWQLWLFVTMITLGAGASAVAEDLTYRAFQFYFAKPVTLQQYLTARIAAVGFWCFLITFVPALLVVLALVGTAPADMRLDRVGLLLPALIHCLLIAAVGALASIGVSSLSRSRALTMSAWILIFVVPEALATIVWKIAHWPWLQLASLPSLLGIVGDALFRVPEESELGWYHALPVIAGVLVGGAYLAMYRVKNAEVVT